MSKSDFLPHTDSEYLVWHNNFRQEVLAGVEDGSVDKEDADLVDRDNAALHAKSDALDTAIALHKRATAEKNEAFVASKANARAVSRRIKAKTKYTPALGVRFGIEGQEVSVNLSEAKPNLSAVDRTGGAVELSFNKLRSDGVNIYCQREGDADWVFLGFASGSPFMDSRPLLQAGKPELRRHCVVYVQKGREIGLFSDDVVVTCAP
jgi:hypothetical protein